MNNSTENVKHQKLSSKASIKTDEYLSNLSAKELVAIQEFLTFLMSLVEEGLLVMKAIEE